MGSTVLCCKHITVFGYNLMQVRSSHAGLLRELGCLGGDPCMLFTRAVLLTDPHASSLGMGFHAASVSFFVRVLSFVLLMPVVGPRLGQRSCQVVGASLQTLFCVPVVLARLGSAWHRAGACLPGCRVLLRLAFICFPGVIHLCLRDDDTGQIRTGSRPGCPKRRP